MDNQILGARYYEQVVSKKQSAECGSEAAKQQITDTATRPACAHVIHILCFILQQRHWIGFPPERGYMRYRRICYLPHNHLNDVNLNKVKKTCLI